MKSVYCNTLSFQLSQFVVDTTPPNGGLVNDGPTPGTDVSFSGSLTTVSATWNGFLWTTSLVSIVTKISVYRRRKQFQYVSACSHSNSEQRGVHWQPLQLHQW